MAGQVGRDDEPRRRERRAHVFEHVRGLASTVQAHDRRCVATTPPEVVHLEIVDERERAVTAAGNVVTRRTRPIRPTLKGIDLKGIGRHAGVSSIDTFSPNNPGASAGRTGRALPT